MPDWTFQGMEAKEEVQREMAAALLKSIFKIRSYSLCCHLIIIQLLLVINTGLIG
jgi:hypothetical protein